MDLYKHERTKYDVPVDHLDYRYVEQCSDVKELEKILKILRSGKEGTYPDLEAATEKKLAELNPKSRVLLKDQPIFSTKELGKEGSALATDFEQWASGIQSMDSSIKSASGTGSNLPPVRGSASISLGQQGVKKNETKKAEKKPMPRSHKDWDKVDIEAELRKLDDEQPESGAGKPKNVLRNPARPSIPERVNATGLTDDEKRYKAEKEKEKGNEAFRAGDYEEALLYYTRSISLVASVASVNNRAQTYVKLEKWDEAIADCGTVLQQEPGNLKAHLRRSVAYKSKKLFREAKKDLDLILEKEPNNKRAKELLAEVEDGLAEQKVKGRRMVIEEVSDDDESDDGGEAHSEGPSTHAASDVTDAGALNSETRNKPETMLNKNENEAGVPEETKQGVESAQTVESAPTMESAQTVESGQTVESAQAVESAQTVESTQTVESAQAETVPTPQPPTPLSPELIKLKEDGNQLFRNGSYAEAISKYNRIIDKLENDESQGESLSVVYSNRAACRTKIGDCAGCVEDCSKALVLTAHALKPLMRRAMAYEALEKYRQAYVDYRHILSIDHSIDVALKGATRCQKTLAEQDGPKWREKLPPIPTVSRSQLPQTPMQVRPAAAPSAGSQVAQQHVPEVTKAEARVSQEELYEKHKTEGNGHVKKGKFKDAIASYTRCIELCPDKAAAYTNRALCYLRLNKPQEVVEDCGKAMDYEPENVKALFRRGQAYKMLCKYAESERDLQLVLSIEPGNTAAKRELKLVQNYIAEEQAKKRREDEQASKGRRRIQIQEVDSSGDESESDVTQSANNVTEIVNNATESEKNVTESEKNLTPSEKHVTESGKNVNERETDQGNISATNLTGHQTPDSKSKSELKDKSKSPDPRTVLSETQAKASDMQHQGQGRQSEVKGQSSQGGEQGVTYDMKASKPSTKIRPTAELTKGDKATPYEFMTAWAALKNVKGVDPYLQILKQVDPEKLPTVISNKLEGDMLEKIVQCVHKMADFGEARRGFEYMRHLTKVPRFKMNTMFMSRDEKQEINGVLEKLSKDVAKEELSELKKQYGV